MFIRLTCYFVFCHARLLVCASWSYFHLHGCCNSIIRSSSKQRQPSALSGACSGAHLTFNSSRLCNPRCKGARVFLGLSELTDWNWQNVLFHTNAFYCKDADSQTGEGPVWCTPWNEDRIQTQFLHYVTDPYTKYIVGVLVLVCNQKKFAFSSFKISFQ